MITALNYIFADFELYKDLTVLLIIGGIILIILIVVVIIYSKTGPDNKKKYFDDDIVYDHFSIKETNFNDKEHRSDYERLISDLAYFKENNRELNERLHFLEKKHEDLIQILNKYIEKYGQINKSDSKPQECSSIDDTENTQLIFKSESIDDEISRVEKINVSFSFEDKNGTVKKDNFGDMFITRLDDNNYELNTNKEIYGTAIHLEQLQYSYRILNPKDANNKPMRIIKKPLYKFDSAMNRGFLINKGEVEYL